MVSNNRRTKLLPKILAGQLFVACIITAMALFVIYYAQGYRFSLKSMKTTQTGVVFIDFSPNDAVISINDVESPKKDSYTDNLEPGFYNFEIKKEGYSPWALSLKIETESVNVFEDVVLFKSDIVPTVLSDERKIALLNTPEDILAAGSVADLSVNGAEIWAGDRLATRLSSPVLSTFWYSDQAHIIYQQGNDVRIIEKNGTNDTLLFKLEQETAAKLVVGSRGEELYFIDKDIYKVARIR